MLEPTVQSALVVLVAFLLKLGADALHIPLDATVLAALAAAIVAWLLGTASGTKVAARIRPVK